MERLNSIIIINFFILLILLKNKIAGDNNAVIKIKLNQQKYNERFFFYLTHFDLNDYFNFKRCHKNLFTL